MTVAAEKPALCNFVFKSLLRYLLGNKLANSCPFCRRINVIKVEAHLKARFNSMLHNAFLTLFLA